MNLSGTQTSDVQLLKRNWLMLTLLHICDSWSLSLISIWALTNAQFNEKSAVVTRLNVAHPTEKSVHPELVVYRFLYTYSTCDSARTRSICPRSNLSFEPSHT